MTNVTRTNRPDVTEFTWTNEAGRFELWWDDQDGVEAGWVLNLPDGSQDAGCGDGWDENEGPALAEHLQAVHG